MTTTLKLPAGAKWVETSNSKLVRPVLENAHEHKGLAVIDGWNGSGKTSFVMRWAKSTGAIVLYLQFDKEAPPPEVDVALLDALGVEYPSRLYAYERKLLLRKHLAEQDAIVISDETGRAPLPTLSRTRTHHDKDNANWTWIAVGKGSLSKMQFCLDERNRAGSSYIFLPLSPTELPGVLRQFHPAMLGDLDDDFLLRVDNQLATVHAGHGGNLRSWAHLLNGALKTGHGQRTLTTHVVRRALAMVDMTPPDFTESPW